MAARGKGIKLRAAHLMFTKQSRGFCNEAQIESRNVARRTDQKALQRFVIESGASGAKHDCLKATLIQFACLTRE